VTWRVCSTPGCPELTEASLCARHEAERQARIDAKRPTPAARGYDSRWAAIRKRYLAEHPFCEAPGCLFPAVDVDHIDGRGPRGDNSFLNLQALCKSHHARKTARQDHGFGR
jgi:5-methylcytosine-specific restriction protein A